MSDKGLPRDIAGDHELPQDADIRVVDRTVTDSERIDRADETTSRNATRRPAGMLLALPPIPTRTTMPKIVTR